MRKDLVESYLDKLLASFGPVRPPIVEERLQALYDAKDYAGMVRHIQDVLCLDVGIRLGLVNSGGPNAPAWVSRIKPMPMFGTWSFSQLTVTMYLRKSFLKDGYFEEIVCAIAHELCHILLDAIAHSLRDQEEAVDLAAMLLGFRDFYVTGCHSVQDISSPDDILSGINVYQARIHSYLTREEIGHAATYMTFR